MEDSTPQVADFSLGNIFLPPNLSVFSLLDHSLLLCPLTGHPLPPSLSLPSARLFCPGLAFPEPAEKTFSNTLVLTSKKVVFRFVALAPTRLKIQGRK